MVSQIQDPEKFHIFYNSLEITFKKLGFLTEIEDLDDYYESFFRLNYYLKDLFQQHLKREIINKELKGKIGKSDSEIIRNIVIAYLSQSGYLKKE